MFNLYNEELEKFNYKFKNYFRGKDDFDCILNYSIERGKRLRPIILIKTFEMLTKNPSDERVINYAIALELIHNYSLVHDDLPAMDNDDYRRGAETTHKKFGEDLAILAGDCLLNYAYELLFSQLEKSFYRYDLLAAKVISNQAGKNGMIHGQYFDIVEQSKDLESIILMYDMKTCGLIKAATMAGAYLANSNRSVIDDMEKLGFYIGMAFQIQDDLLDYKKDINMNKKTYISFAGIEKAKEDMIRYTDLALAILNRYEGEFLTKLVNSLTNRKF